MRKTIFILIGMTVMLLGCKQQIKEPEMNGSVFQSVEKRPILAEKHKSKIEVELINDDGVGVGVATLVEEDDGVHITVDAHHLTPGIHGFHIHERGICEAPSFESAGGHFNPTNKLHGFDHPEGYHAGDLQNIEVKQDGTISETVKTGAVTLKSGEPNSLLQNEGTALVIHADPDDYVSQPAGNAGERIVCGVIKEPEKDKSS